MLQDLCSVSNKLPRHIWLTDVKVDWSDILGSGGEASIIRARYERKSVAVRVPKIPTGDGKDWKDIAGVLKVQLLLISDIHRIPNELATVDPTGVHYALSLITSKRTPAAWCNTPP